MIRYRVTLQVCTFTRISSSRMTTRKFRALRLALFRFCSTLQYSPRFLSGNTQRKGRVVSVTLLHLVSQKAGVPRAEQHLYVALQSVRVELELHYVMLRYFGQTLRNITSPEVIWPGRHMFTRSDFCTRCPARVLSLKFVPCCQKNGIQLRY